jgi:flagellar hook-length control protein FliK
MSDNLPQVKPGAMPDLTTSNTAPDPQHVEIVFAEETGAERKEPGGEGIRKSLEGKTAGNETPTTFVSGSGELRVDRESRMPTPAVDTRVPLAEQIHNQIREKLDARDNGSNNGRITLRLHPEELGELKINMRMEDQRLKVEIVTENQSVKDALMQNLDTLKETLSRQNIAMDRFNVSADLRQGFQQGARDGRQTTQGNRGTDTGFRPAPATEEDAVTNLRYHWENENSLVNLVL